MKHQLFILLLIGCTVSSMGQTDTAAMQKRQVPSMAIIHTMDGKRIKGWFYRINDDSIYLLPTGKKMSRATFLNTDIDKNNYAYSISGINRISLQKRNAALKGTLIGLGAGVVTGLVIGFASGDDPIQPYTGNPFEDFFIALNNSFAMTAGEKAVAGGLTLGATGALTGFIIGKLAKKKFIIGGKKEAYRDLQSDLMKRLITR
jgi:hypothetical protein